MSHSQISQTNCSRFFAILLMGVFLAGLSSDVMAQNGKYRLGEVLGIRHFELLDGQNEAFDEFVKKEHYPFWDSHFPGEDRIVLVGDRAEHSGHYLGILSLDTVERRNYYYPTHTGPFPRLEEILSEVEAHWTKFDRFERSENDGWGDYCLIGAETVPDLPWIDVLGIHHRKVKEGMEADFEFWVREKWNPQAHQPGFWVLFYKVDRGPNEGNVAMIYAFENRATRTAIFPGTGTPSDIGAQIRPGLDDLVEGHSMFFETPEDAEATYTDWVLIR